MDFEFDKNLSISKTVVLDTKEVSGSDDFVFKFFLPNEFKNVVAIKSFTTCIDIPSTSSIASSNLDVIYIYLNDLIILILLIYQILIQNQIFFQ